MSRLDRSITFAIGYGNLGDATANNVVLTDVVGGGCLSPGGFTNASIGSLAPNCVYRDQRDLHRDHARPMYEQNHDQRFECAIKKLKRNGYGGSCS